MILYCNICKASLKEKEEVRLTADAYWHELGSKIVFSISQPHNVDVTSLRHVDCDDTNKKIWDMY